jgi:glycopeptide antibiotics resistance protein
MINPHVMNYKKTINSLTDFHVTVLTATAIVIVLFFGLNPHTFTQKNGVSYNSQEKGLRFTPPGIAYIDSLFNTVPEKSSKGLTLHLSYSVDDVEKTGFGPIFMAHNGDDTKQLTVWHWGDSLIIMNGNDYSYRKKEPRITLKKAVSPKKRVDFTITSNSLGTKLYKNGVEVAQDSNLYLTLPRGEGKTRLIFGNSVYGKHGFKGVLYGVALYQRVVEKEELKRGVKAQFNQGELVKDAEKVFLLYTFSKKQGTVIIDESGNHHKLRLPSKALVIKKSFLAQPGHYFRNTYSFYFDLIINIIGFIPLGAILYIWFERKGFVEKSLFCTTFSTCFLISLFIEISQGWLPARSSSIMDIVLNATGGLLGIILIINILSSKKMLSESA